VLVIFLGSGSSCASLGVLGSWCSGASLGVLPFFKITNDFLATSLAISL
jgi:hypothetical protein